MYNRYKRIHPLIKDASFTIMCDVTNPLCGGNGATYTFGKQKGGTPEILAQLEIGMQNYRDIILNRLASIWTKFPVQEPQADSGQH